MNALSVFFISALLHPFFISVTDINYNPAEKELEISVRIFTDDFENTLRQQHSNVDIDILHPANKSQMDGFVNDYIQKNLKVQVNGKAVSCTFVGYEQQAESIWTYFEVKNVSTVQKLDIYNALLQDFNSDQINMIHVKVNGKEQTSKLDYPAKKVAFSF